MNQRNTHLINSRPFIASAIVQENMGEEERFQNATLRPILKLQHPLFIKAVQHYIASRNKNYFHVSIAKRKAYLTKILTTDNQFRSQLKGFIIGHFTLAEYEQYLQHKSNINKRMMGLLKQRVLSSMEEITPS